MAARCIYFDSVVICWCACHCVEFAHDRRNDCKQRILRI